MIFLPDIYGSNREIVRIVKRNIVKYTNYFFNSIKIMISCLYTRHFTCERW